MICFALFLTQTMEWEFRSIPLQYIPTMELKVYSIIFHLTQLDINSFYSISSLSINQKHSLRTWILVAYLFMLCGFILELITLTPLKFYQISFDTPHFSTLTLTPLDYLKYIIVTHLNCLKNITLCSFIREVVVNLTKKKGVSKTSRAV